MFERVANAYKWPDDAWVLRLAPLLTGKAQAAYANMDAAKSKDFQQVKQAILRIYNINEETYHDTTYNDSEIQRIKWMRVMWKQKYD